MYTSLTATSLTLAAFLRQQLETDSHLKPLFDPGAGGTMVVSLMDPQEMAALPAEGLSLWLYRAIRDEDRINAAAIRQTPREVRMPPLPMRLHYLVTPVIQEGSNAPELEQMVLGKVLQLLYDHCRFRGTDLVGDFSGTDIEFTTRLETMTLEEITRVWTALAEPYRLSVSYEASVLPIRSQRVEDITPVRIAIPQPGIIVAEEAI
jgi:Pvc16 N-terminal domain